MKATELLASARRDVPAARRDSRFAARQQVRSHLHLDSPNPVGPADAQAIALAIPGVWDRWQFMAPLASRLAPGGIRTYFVPQLGNNLAPIEDSAEVVGLELERVLRLAGATPVVLLGHSKGCLIGLQVLRQHLGRTPGPVGLVALSAPFGGSEWANLFRTPDLRELRVTNPEIARTRTDAQTGRAIVTIRPAFDPHVPSPLTPPGATQLELATAGHFQPLSTPQGARAVRWAIRQLVARPQPPAGDRSPDHPDR